MGFAGAGMEPLSHQLACGIEHDGPHQRVRAGAALPERSQLEGSPHPGQPGGLKGAGRGGSRRHQRETMAPMGRAG
ncbi:hypothetical protein LBMAG41_08310 [Cyanobium sp.]|nr:hypothetical protein LBMAG41_08310 [Cyanobium sp.]